MPSASLAVRRAAHRLRASEPSAAVIGVAVAHARSDRRAVSATMTSVQLKTFAASFLGWTLDAFDYFPWSSSS